MTEFDNLVALVTEARAELVPLPLRYWSSAERTLRIGSFSRRRFRHVFGVVCDVVDSNQVNAAVALIAEHFGALDIVINNAGSAPRVTSPRTVTRSGIASSTSTSSVSRASVGRHCLSCGDRITPRSLTPARSSRCRLPNRALYSASKALSHQSRWLWLPTTCEKVFE